jgi:glyoxylase-like metal-dependent hydrolase (beta-lactamase superfamily II)
LTQLRKIPDELGISFDYGNFIIIRPRLHYRMAGGVFIIKGDNPVIIDTGFPIYGIYTIKKAFKKHRIDKNSVSFIICTHSHPDHSLNLFRLKKLCKNAKIICHKNELHDLQHIAQVSRTFKQNFDIANSRFLNLLNRFLGPFSRLFIFILTFYPRIDYLVTQDFRNEEFSLDKCPKIRAGNKILTIIPTIGHSVGHISILDNRGNLFLGDFVPFTPWINPEVQALDDLIQSIKNILTIENESKVKLAIRSHGDIRRKGSWEISTWIDEKNRFQLFLETINNSLQKIPQILKDKPLNIREITLKLRPRKKYSTILERFSFQPNFTWTYVYCLKLEKMQKIKRIIIKRRLYWTII